MLYILAPDMDSQTTPFQVKGRNLYSLGRFMLDLKKPRPEPTWRNLDSQLLGIRETYLQFKNYEERRTQGYISAMVDVLVILNRFQEEIVKENLCDVLELENRKSNTLYFQVSYKGEDFSFPFDFEFVLELEPALAFLVYEKLRDSHQRLILRNRRVYLALKRQLQEETSPSLGELNVFEEVRSLSRQIDKKIKLATIFGNKTASLNILHEGFYSPAQIHFRLLRVLKVLKLPNHPYLEEARYFLKNSYFKGSEEALRQNLKTEFITLTRESERLARRAQNITEPGSLTRDRAKADADRAWYGAGVSESEEVINGVALGPLARYWLELQRIPFDDIKRDWDAQIFEDDLGRLRRSEKPTRAGLEELVCLLETIRDRIARCTNLDNVVFTSLRIERSIELKTEQEVDQCGQWIWSNRLRLINRFYEVLEEIEKWKAKKPQLQLSRHLEETLAMSAGNPEQVSQKARDEFLQAEADLGWGNWSETWEDTLEAIDTGDQPADVVARLLKLHKNLEDQAGFFAMGECGWFARLRAAWPESNEREQQLSYYFERLDELDDRRNRVLEELKIHFEKLDDYTAVGIDNLDACLDILTREKIRNLVACAFPDMGVANYQNKLTRMLACEKGEEKLLQLAILVRELDLLPTQKDLGAAMKAWEGDLSVEIQTEYRAIIQENRPELDKLVQQARAAMRDCLNNGEAIGEARTRCEAFNLWQFAAQHLETELALARHDIPHISSVKGASTASRRIQAIRERILEAQKTICATKGWPSSLHDLVSPDELASEVADRLVPDLEANHEALKALMKRLDSASCDLGAEEKRFGSKADLAHLSQTLQAEDLGKIQQIFGLKESVEYQDVQRLAHLHRTRSQLRSVIFERLLKHTLSPQEDVPRVIGDVFKRADYKAYKSGNIRTELMLALLVAYPDLLESDCHLLALVLNHASPKELLVTTLFKNYTAIFSLVSERTTRVNATRIWNHMRIWLETRYTVIKDSDNYSFNRKQLSSSVQKIFQTHS